MDSSGVNAESVTGSEGVFAYFFLIYLRLLDITYDTCNRRVQAMFGLVAVLCLFYFTYYTMPYVMRACGFVKGGG